MMDDDEDDDEDDDDDDDDDGAGAGHGVDTHMCYFSWVLANIKCIHTSAHHCDADRSCQDNVRNTQKPVF